MLCVVTDAHPPAAYFILVPRYRNAGTYSVTWLSLFPYLPSELACTLRHSRGI